ncbi:KH domain-containing protein [Candidatus Peregrinibacteria bacterium]|nr:KH domain-containing protein [Candidatus Peregrinibacteria bacterium]
MDTEEILEETLKNLLERLGVEYKKISVTEEEKNSYIINIESGNPSLLIGYHGENIHALQHILKVLIWQKTNSEQFNIIVDVDNYRQRQEENIIELTERKIETLRKTGKKQIMPPMSPYFRRKIHLHCMGAGYDDIETYSEGEDDHRHIVLKLK